MPNSVVFTPFVTPTARSFKAYEPGRSIDEIRQKYGLSRVIKLASNENPLGVSPMVQDVLRDKAESAFRYPQAGNPRLCAALGALHGVSPSRIVTSNGSDEIIDLLFRVCAEPRVHNAAAFKPCFGIYTTQAKFAGVELRQTPLNDDFSFDFESLEKSVDQNTTLVFVTSPDNPSGYGVKKEEIARLAEKLPPRCLLIVDEAYVDFARIEDGGEAAFSACSLLETHPNIAVLRTFSKSRGMAGLRLGYAILPEEIASYIWRVRLPFSVNILAEEAGLAVLRDVDFYARTRETVEQGRQQLESGMTAQGWEVLRSQANFMMMRHPGIHDGALINEALLKRGVIVRPLRSYGLPEYLRVSVGTEEENVFFLHVLQDALNEVVNA